MPHHPQEGDLIFDFDYALNKPRTKFESKYLQTKTSIRPVDFLIELEELYRFVEVKDPDVPGANNVEKFQEEMASGEIIEDLSRKFRDSHFFFINQCEDPKSIDYVVLICWKKLDPLHLPALSERLRRTIPWTNGSYGDIPLRACVIMTLDKWKEEFGENSVWRESDFEE